jgi:hypothetical protein
MSLTAVALRAALTMTNDASEQRTAQDGGQVGETAQKLIALAHELIMLHY